MMDVREFIEKMKDEIRGYLPDDMYREIIIDDMEVVKMNDQKLHGLTFRMPGSDAAPTLYVDDMFRAYKDGADITNVAPKDRNIGIVFQNYSLFPNMDVYHNISYALQAKHLGKDEIDKKVKEIIETVGLEEHIYKKPKQLSGGQQQRVAIARTLVLNPDIILFDEPMSALDADIKVVLRQQLKDIQKKLQITMIYVTHDQEEAFALSDRIMVLNDLRIAQMDTPYNLYHHPADSFVKRFIVEHLDLKVKSIEDSI